MEKIVIRYIGGAIGEPGKGQIFGGTAATNYAIKRAFENSELFDLQIKTRVDFNDISEAKEFLDGGDISWLDDTSFLEAYFEAGHARPDLIGPISRSPIKRYNNGNWRSKYTPEYFYSGKILRLNEAEEKESTRLDEFDGDYVKYISFIRHGIDLDLMKERRDVERIDIMWAGNSKRPAKNYAMWEEIQKIINEKYGGLPLPYEFRTMSGYKVDDYWNMLDGAALLVNTSLYESFCCAVAEGRAKGVGALVKENFNGFLVHLDQPGQTYYSPEIYAKKIMELCNDKEKMKKLQQDSFSYVNKNCSLDAMKEDIEEVLLEILEDKL